MPYDSNCSHQRSKLMLQLSTKQDLRRVQLLLLEEVRDLIMPGFLQVEKLLFIQMTKMCTIHKQPLVCVNEHKHWHLCFSFFFF